jgi:hypothetical protein
MHVAELLGGDDLFVADTSAWWRVPDLPGALAGMLNRRSVTTAC